MATDSNDPHSHEADAPWSANHPAIERSLQPAPEGGGEGEILESLVHPAYPFVEAGVAGDAALAGNLREVAKRYLARIVDTMPEAASFAQAHWEHAAFPWNWYDLRWGAANLDEGPQDARLSFWVELDTAAGPKSRTAVLLAGPQWRTGVRQDGTGGGEGLRVVLHVGPRDGQGRHVVRITGATFGLPPVAKDPSEAVGLFGVGPASLFSVLRSQLAAKLGPDYATRELSVLPSKAGRIAGSTLVGPADNPRVMSWALRITPATGAGANPADFRLHYEYLVEQVTHATTPNNPFGRDPASAGKAAKMVERRPTRDEAELAVYLPPRTGLPPAKTPTPRSRAKPYHELREGGTNPRIMVQGTALSQNTHDPVPAPQKVPAGPLPLRSDDQAAVDAYLRGLELMERLQNSGLTPESYFRFAKLPLILRHRAAMKKGNPGGHSVNAQVQPTGTGQRFDETFDPARRPQLEVRFGAANLTHRAVHTAYHGRRRPQYMGLAADRRWAWHEFGHVLSWAATGELEFAFAHSAGDALAAILNDPESQLAHDGNGPARRDEPAAGLTFPWVPIKRRHDRNANLGWCWCGRRNTRRLSPLPPGARIFTGYFAEQLLSSTLFRVYRALGGDAVDAAVRQKAADYTVYLIMRAIQLLGPATCVAARQATHFFDALVQAEVGTTAWHYPVSDPNPAPAAVRIGGMAHKVIRWAFEQQGLFAAEHPGEIAEGIGRPPRVDVHVYGDGSANDGGYGPHALDLPDPGNGAPPRWHASAQGLSAQGGELHFKLGNRGSEQALGVSAKAWAAAATGPGPLQWQPLSLSQGSPTVLDIGPGGTNSFRFEAAAAGSPLNGRCYLLASASCSADRSNLDPVAGLACAGDPPSGPRQLAELVAGDNNIGLVLLDLP